MVKEESTLIIPDGIPKSGRVWKAKQTSKSSLLIRSSFCGPLKTFEEKEQIRNKRKQMLQMERDMKADRVKKIVEEKERREQQTKRRMENEYKSSVYQMVCHAILFHFFPALSFLHLDRSNPRNSRE